jgi:phytoene synthase
MVDLESAYDACARDCRAHYENFPVASFLLPRGMRPHIAAVYAFARAADDFADEGERTVDERHRLLDGWSSRLHEAAAGATSTLQRPPERGEPPHTREIFLALGVTVRRLQLPLNLFDDLLSAFRQDISVHRYTTWESLFDYCRRSANPVGRLVLRIGGYTSGELDRWSDAICTALQLTNFWQDVGKDYARGRIYLPAEEMQAHRAGEGGLAERKLSPEWRSAIAAAVGRTRTLFNDGLPLCDRIRGRLRYELRLTWLGGNRILDRIEARRFDVLKHRPTLGAGDIAWLAGVALGWPRSIQRYGLAKRRRHRSNPQSRSRGLT